MRLYRRLRCRLRQAETLASIPGVNVLRVDGADAVIGVTLDAYPVVCRRLKRAPKPDTIDENQIEVSSALPLRPYQILGVKRILADWQQQRFAYLGDDIRLGKQQPISAKVATPNGWRTIGSLRVGDYVLGSNGSPTKVIGVFPQGVQPVYRMRFTDDSFADAGPEHLWRLRCQRGKSIDHWQTLTTLEVKHLKEHGKSWQQRMFLPMLTAPLHFLPSSDLPIDAYTLGHLIGNGSLSQHSVVLTTNAHDWSQVEPQLQPPASSNRLKTGCYAATIPGLMPAIRALGLDVLSGSKFIPLMYQRAASKDRIRLLQGLMDSDGSCVGNRLIFCTTSAQLAEDFLTLAEGVGCSGSVRSYDRLAEGKPIEYRVQFKAPTWVQPFTVSRKSQRYNPGGAYAKTHPMRSVKSVDCIGEEESVCIAVEAPDKLYVTTHCVLTHNTPQAIAAVEALGTGTRALVLCPALVLRHWAREIRRWLPAQSVLILDGRAADTARLIDDSGQTILTQRELKPLIARCARGNDAILDADGRPLAYCSSCRVARRQCDGQTDCPTCSDLLASALASAQWVICPYDRLIPQTTSDERGREYQRDDLPGWALSLSRIDFNVAIADEVHKLRAALPGDQHRSRMAYLAASRARLKLGLSGTPSFGKFRHMWGQLNWLSDGAYGRDEHDQPAPWIWDRYFCNGRKVAVDGRPGLRVWKADEAGPRVASEWASIRRDRLILARRRVDVAKDLPPLIRDVRRIESDGEIKKPSRRVKNQLDWALARALEIKLGAFADAVADELVTGAKVLVLAKRTASVDQIAAKLTSLVDGRGEMSAEIRNRNGIVINARGLIAEKRAKLVETFVDHDGAGALVTTIDSLADGGISMRGVSSVHHLEYHDSPSATVQAELRGYEPGIANGYAITHWHATGTIDDEIESRVMPQVEMIANAFADPTAAQTADVFRARARAASEEKVDFEAALARYLGE